MTQRASEVVAVVHELAPRVVTAHLQDVRVPRPTAVVLSLRRPGHTEHLLLEAGTGSAAVHTIERPPPNPKEAIAFQGLLRKELGGRLTSMVATGDGAAVELRFSSAGGERTLRWVGGRQGSIELHQEDRLLGAIGSAGPQAGAPAGPNRLDAPFDLAARAWFTRSRTEGEVAEARRALRRHLGSRRKSAARLVRKRREEADRGADADRLQAEGDLLQSSFRLLRRGMDTIEVPDWNRDGALTALKLDPALSPPEQVERRYRRARRARRAGREAAARIPEAEARVESLTRALARLSDSESLDDVQAVVDGLPGALRPRSSARRAKVDAARALPWRTYLTRRGIRILAGRGARENDELTLRHANGNDLWLHVRGRPGAHVVVRSPGAAPAPELLRLAGQVALAHSGVPDGEAADVAWTRVKFVQKKKGMPPGKVLVTQERVLHLRADRSALEELERPTR